MVAFTLATLLAVATAVAAYPGGLLTRSGTCSSGTLSCCNSVQPASSDNYAELDGLLPIAAQGLGLPIGVTCNPISIIGAGTSGSCSSQAACCDDVTSDAMGVNCVPLATPI